MSNKPDIIQWSDLPTDLQDIVIKSHSRHYNTENRQALRNAFNAGNPLLIVGKEKKGVYTQIHPTSTTVMQVLIKSHLLSYQ